MQLIPIANKPFGAVAENIDCASITNEQAERIRRALHEHQLLVIPVQHHLLPSDEVHFYQRINGEQNSFWRDQSNNPWEVYKVEQGNQAGTYQIPEEPGVLVLGKGDIDHYGLKVTLGGDRFAYGDDEGSQVLGGGALQWHIDGTFYNQEPCVYTQMRCVEPSNGSGHWLDYDDGTGAKLWCEAGSTAFASGRFGFKQLSPNDQQLVLNTTVHYFSQPFQTTYHLGNNANGLRVVDPQAEEQYADEVDIATKPQDDPLAKVYPLVWTCPVTGERALMPHPRCLQFLECASDSGDSIDVRTLNVMESRCLVERLMRPAIEPDSVYVHVWKAGDLVIWYNRSMWHSATGKLSKNDRRIQHLTAFNSDLVPT